MGETTLKLMLWTLPWLILVLGIGYGFSQSEDIEHFLLGNMPVMLKDFSEIKFSEKTFGLKGVEITGKSVVTEFYFASPFPFPVKIKEVLIKGETKSGDEFELKLEKEVLIRPYENSTLTLRGNLPRHLPESDVKLKDARVSVEIFGILVEVEG
ncbi:MAG: hypothetical protein H0Z28_11505 [Archaeoglobus sp.]|nr:hypothetical protein [Archaeoglobus sp.]